MNPKTVMIVAALLVALLAVGAFVFVKEEVPSAPKDDAASQQGIVDADGDGIDDAVEEVYDYIEQSWEQTAIEALDYFGGDVRLADLVQAMIYVESGGDPDVDYYHDIMMAREGDTRNIITEGLARKGIKACTPEASIYAGVAILVDACDDFNRYLGREADPDNLSDMGLLAQGYNYGHRGWFLWLQKNGIFSWSLDASLQYQATIGGIGTANHGQKVMDAYDEIRRP